MKLLDQVSMSDWRKHPRFLAYSVDAAAELIKTLDNFKRFPAVEMLTFTTANSISHVDRLWKWKVKFRGQAPAQKTDNSVDAAGD